MAVCRIIETGVAPEQYDQVREGLGLGDGGPPGAKLHVAAVTDDGKVKIIEVWESKEEAQAFGERVMAAREAAGVGGADPVVTYLDVYNVVQA